MFFELRQILITLFCLYVYIYKGYITIKVSLKTMYDFAMFNLYAFLIVWLFIYASSYFDFDLLSKHRI